MTRSLGIRALFAVTIFTAATLVFLVQPMIVKQLLPVFGGSPSVWNTAVVFFQCVLLLGYASAHFSFRALSLRRQPLVPLIAAAISLVFVPFTVHKGANVPDAVPPALWVGALLAASVGVPYLAVTMASPILQRWYAETGERGADNPYFLYTASNAGSLVGLLAFPFLLEPSLSTTGQERVWATGLVLYLVTLASCAVVMRRRAGRPAVVGGGPPSATAPLTPMDLPLSPTPVDAPRVTRWQRVRWILLAAIPSSLMLGVTTFITTDVASAPMLWVVPLALYLVSFMLTFGHRFRIGPNPAGILVAISASALVLVTLGVWSAGQMTEVAVHLVAMLCAAVLCHALLYASRPGVDDLTGFYLLMSVGGVVGGAFTALAAPVLFDRIYEYPLLLAAVVAIRPGIWSGLSRERSTPLTRSALSIVELSIAVVLMLALASNAVGRSTGVFHMEDGQRLLLACIALGLLALRRWGLTLAVTVLFVLFVFGQADENLFVDRNFFGTVRVDNVVSTHRLLHGTTNHGTQFTDSRRDVPSTYYSRPGPLGDVFREFQRVEPFRQVGDVGLGSGNVLAYSQPGQRFTFYEIDPAVIKVAEDPKYFTWIRDAKADEVKIVDGDARLSLEDEPDGKYDLLILDAYSSDAVPVHLLTTEAFRMYKRKLAPGGRMAMHISSRHLDLEPVVAANARKVGLDALGKVDDASSPEQQRVDAVHSHWIALAPDSGSLDPLRDVSGWKPLVKTTPDDAWTDDFSNIAGAIDWSR